MIGRGGMGIVFSAIQLKSRRPVAIKLLQAGAASEPYAFLHFLREGHLASRVRHPRVAAIYDVGIDASLRIPFIAMERVAGRTLREVLDDDGPLEPARAGELCVSIADALAACHARGVVHRDVKPENIIVTTGSDRVDLRLIDFGVARLIEHDGTRVSQDPMMVGTLPYMSPEQVMGGHLDHRSDLFALGCVLHEMLTGSPPFRSLGDTIRWASGCRSAHSPTDALSGLARLNDGLLRLHAALLQPDASARPSSASEVLGALTAGKRSINSVRDRPEPELRLSS